MLSSNEILQAIQDGKLIIDPFIPENLGPNGYDVTLDPRYWTFRDIHYKNLYNGRPTVVDLRDPNMLDLDDLYELRDAREGEYKDAFTIEPFRFYLCNTVETVGTPHTGSGEDLVAFFRTRSTIARLGKTYDLTGMGDIGFVSKWTLEVFNASPLEYIMPINGRIGQVIFFRSGDTDRPYKGRYSTEDTVWSPRNMLPRISSIPPRSLVIGNRHGNPL